MKMNGFPISFRNFRNREAIKVGENENVFVNRVGKARIPLRVGSLKPGQSRSGFLIQKPGFSGFLIIFLEKLKILKI